MWSLFSRCLKAVLRSFGIAVAEHVQKAVKEVSPVKIVTPKQKPKQIDALAEKPYWQTFNDWRTNRKERRTPINRPRRKSWRKL